MALDTEELDLLEQWARAQDEADGGSDPHFRMALKACLELKLARLELDGMRSTKTAPPAEPCQEILPLSIRHIQTSVCEHFGITLDEMCGHTRWKRLTLPRHIAAYLVRELTRHPVSDIAREFGERDHSTIIYAIRRIAEQMIDPHVASHVEAIRAAVQGGPER